MALNGNRMADFGLKLEIYPYLCNIMKKVAAIIIYWSVVILLTTTMLVSLDMAFSRALFISSLFLPGAIITRFVLPTLLGNANRHSRKNLVFFILGILTLEILLIMVGCQVIITADNMLYSDVFQKPVVPEILFNPIFISAIVTLTCGGDYLLLKDFTKKSLEDKKSDTLTFTSDRKTVTLAIGEISYVESNDTEVYVYALDGTAYRNKTPITQWANLLGENFLRTHRSFLVNHSQIASVQKGSVILTNGAEIPISRKYKDVVSQQT